MEALQTRIGYRFQNNEFLAQALSHPSIAKAPSNQRLEFLGDAILGAVIAHMLYNLFPGEPEGDLARRQAALVRGETLTTIARDIGLGDALRLTESEAATGGRNNSSNLEDALEALIGALYLDGGLAAAEAFIMPRWSALAQSTALPPKDAKTSLQEWAQGHGLPVPTYTLIESTGPAHAPIFTIEACVQGHDTVRAQASGKRAAEHLAAAELLGRLGA